MRAWPNFSRVPNVRITASYVTPSTTCSTREPLASSSASGNDGALVVALLVPLPKPLGFFDPESLPPPPLALSGDVAGARDLLTGALPFLDLLEGPCERKRGAGHARSAPSVESHGLYWQPSQHALVSLRAEGATEPREGRLGTCGAAHLRSRCPSGLRSGRCGRSSSGRRRVSLT